MSRYFLEVAYRGTLFSGFQKQQNATTIQGEIDRALSLLLKNSVATTGSSRTDAGVHAFQNFLHFDASSPLPPKLAYALNAVLSPDIAIRGLYPAPQDAHARFDALSRSYLYRVYRAKDPFRRETGYFFPYALDFDQLVRCAECLAPHSDYERFSKRNTQVTTFHCRITEAVWEQRPDEYLFRITANRFLRGMVRGLVATMMKVARGKSTVAEFQQILQGTGAARAEFSAPPQGLFLRRVAYPAHWHIPGACLPLTGEVPPFFGSAEKDSEKKFGD